MTFATALIIPFPVREKSLEMLRDAVWQLEAHELLAAAGSLVCLAAEASERGDDADFYDRAKSAYLILERVLVEGDRF